MVECFDDGQVTVVQLYVFAYQRDGNVPFARVDVLDKFLPGRNVQPCLDAKFTADNVVKTVFVQHKGCLVQAVHRRVADYAVFLDVAEQRDFTTNVVAAVAVTARNDDVGRNTHGLQFLDGVLRRLAFVLVGSADVRHKTHVDKQAVVAPHFGAELADSFEERLTFDVADRAADFGNYNVRVALLGIFADKIFNFVGYVRNDLYRFAEVLALTFLVEHRPVHLAACKVAVFGKVGVDKTLIVSKVKVGFRTVVGYKHFAVLGGIHRTRVDVHVRVKFLCGNAKSAKGQQSAQRCGNNALSESRHNAACNENVLCHFFSSRK